MDPQPRLRRSSEEIRARVLDAARDLFAERGYEATTVRDICNRSGVAQQQLFHNFGTKQGVFDAAFVEPLADIVDRHISAFDVSGDDTPMDERIVAFVNGLYDLASENRGILLSAISRRKPSNQGDPRPPDLLDRIATTLHHMEVIAEAPPGVDVPAAILATASMVFGAALLDDLLYPADSPRINRDRLTAEMVRTILHGTLHRDAVTSQKSGQS